MFKNLFSRKDTKKEIRVVERIGEPHTLSFVAKQDTTDNTIMDLEIGEGLTNNEYVSIVSNVLLYLAVNTVLRYNLNPEAYIDLLKTDVLNALANAQLKTEEGEPNE